MPFTDAQKQTLTELDQRDGSTAWEVGFAKAAKDAGHTPLVSARMAKHAAIAMGAPAAAVQAQIEKLAKG